MSEAYTHIDGIAALANLADSSIKQVDQLDYNARTIKNPDLLAEKTEFIPHARIKISPTEAKNVSGIVVIGKDHSQLPGLEARRFTQLELKGNDRLVVVSFDPEKLAAMTAEEKQALGIPPNLVLDENHPVAFGTQTPAEQAGVFYEFGRELTRLKKTDALTLELMLKQANGDWNVVRSMAGEHEELKKVADYMIAYIADKKNDLHDIPWALREWVNGKKVWVTNSGSWLRGDESPDPALVFVDPTLKEETLPIVEPPRFTPLGKLLEFKKMVMPQS